MTCIIEENALLRRELETAKQQLARMGLVHDFLGQKSDELVIRFHEQQQQQHWAKRKRSRSLGYESAISSRSTSSSPIRCRSPRVNEFNPDLDLFKMRLQTKSVSMEDERNTAQAESNVERDGHQQSDNQHHGIIKMMAYLLYEFGADQNLLLSFVKSCKSDDVTEIEQSEHGRDLLAQAMRTRQDGQKMKAALDEYRVAFEAQQKEAEEERNELRSRLSAIERESNDRRVTLEELTDFRESTYKLRNVLNLARLTREGDPPTPIDFESLSAKLDKAGLSVTVKQLTKSVTNALYAIEKNAIQVATEQANKACDELRSRLAAEEVSLDLERNRAEAFHSAWDACVRQKDEALQSVKTMKEAVEAAELRLTEYKMAADAMRSSAQDALRRATPYASISDATPVVVQPSSQTDKTVVCVAFETFVNICAQKAFQLTTLTNQLSNLRNINVKLMELKVAKDAELEKCRSQVTTTQKELNVIQQAYTECEKSLEAARRDVQLAQQALQSSTEEWRRKAEESRVAFQELLVGGNKAIEQVQSELKISSDSLERAVCDAFALRDEFRSKMQKLDSLLELPTTAQDMDISSD